MDLEARRRAADENVAAAFSLARDHFGDPRGGGNRFGPVEAIATGVELGFYNPVLVFDPASSPANVLAASDWIAGRGLPMSIHVRDDVGPEIAAALVERGFRIGPQPTPVMVLEPIPRAPAADLEDVTLRAGGAELGDDFHAALESGDLFRRLFGPGFLADPGVRIATAYLEGEPVAGAAVMRSGAVVGVYAVWTQERARRRGIGRAVTWAAIDAGRQAWNGSIAILQSSEMGVPVYRSMGFEQVSHYVEFVPPQVSPPEDEAGASPDP